MPGSDLVRRHSSGVETEPCRRISDGLAVWLHPTTHCIPLNIMNARMPVDGSPGAAHGGTQQSRAGAPGR
jgi:hypothetical protein